MPKPKLKPWMDEERNGKECLYWLGVPDNRYIPKRYQKLWVDIFKIRMQLDFCHFPESSAKSCELLATFTKELRDAIQSLNRRSP